MVTHTVNREAGLKMNTLNKDIKCTVSLDNYQFKVTSKDKQIFEDIQDTHYDFTVGAVNVAVDLVFRFGTNYNYFTGYIWETCYTWFYEDLVEDENIDEDIAHDIIQTLTELTYDMFALVITCIRYLGSLGHSRNDALDMLAETDWSIVDIIYKDTEEIEVIGTFDFDKPF